jgi:predicted ATP-dependent protease
MREANFWATQAGQEINAAAIQQAIDARHHRSDRVRERLLEATLREIRFVATEGATVGQVNGLSVITLGDFSFGQPNRITARVRLGKGEVVDIEREVELGGPLHSKGVLILSSFLASRYAAQQPLSLQASLVFEQSYGGVEGDSASVTELCALLSAIAHVPIKQSLAVTGSVNQHGEVQAIGGVNEKIEGFFDLCTARGLTGDQGVIIPESNVQHLMLRQDVINAVQAGTFHVYPVKQVDEAFSLLTGLEAGVLDEAGLYPETSLNGKVIQQLQMMTQAQLAFARASKAESES